MENGNKKNVINGSSQKDYGEAVRPSDTPPLEKGLRKQDWHSTYGVLIVMNRIHALEKDVEIIKSRIGITQSEDDIQSGSLLENRVRPIASSEEKAMTNSEIRAKLMKKLFFELLLFFIFGIFFMTVNWLIGATILFVGLANLFLHLYSLWRVTNEQIINPRLAIAATLGSVWLAMLSLISLFV